MGSYKSPNKLNLISFILLLAAAGGLYWLIQFGPTHYRRWQAKSVLSEAAAKAYGKRVFHDPDDTEKLEAVLDWTERRLRGIGITDPGLSVDVQDGAANVTAMASYTERIKHPLVDKTTVLYFRPKNMVKKDKGAIEE